MNDELENPNGQRAVSLWTAFCAAGLFVALALPALRGNVYTANDLGEFHLPLRSFYADCLNSGDAFDWCPRLYCGFYLTGEGQLGGYHPVHWLLYRWLPLAVAWNLECLISYPFMFVGTVLLLRSWRLSAATCWFGALAFTFSSFNLLHFVHVNAVAVVAHVPWLLYCIDILMCKTDDNVHPNPKRQRGRSANDVQTSLTLRVKVVGHPRQRLAWCGIAILTASQILLGYPQYVLLSVLAELAYLAVLIGVDSHPCDGRIRAPWRMAAIWSLAKLLGFAIAAVQLLPTFDSLGESVRASSNANFAASGSLHPLNLLQLVAPCLFATRVVGQNTHELGLYVGAVPLLLAIVALTSARQRRVIASLPSPLINSPSRPEGEGLNSERIGRSFAIAIIIVGFVLALGEHGPLHGLVSRLPIVGQMRFPCRAIVLVQLGLTVLAAIGFGRLAHGHVRTVSAPVWLVVLASFVIPGVAVALWPIYLSSPLLIAAGPLLFSVAAMLIWLAISTKLGLYALVALAAIDLGCYGFSYAVYTDNQSLTSFIATTSAPDVEPNGRVVLETLQADTTHRAGNRILLKGWQRADGYAGLEPAKRLDYQNTLTWYITGVTWIANDPIPQLPDLDTNQNTIVHRAASEQPSPLREPKLRGETSQQITYEKVPGVAWLKVEAPLPRARLVHQVQPSMDYRKDVSRIDLDTTVMIEPADDSRIREYLVEPTQPTSSSNDAHDSIASNVALISDRPGVMQLLVQSDRHAIVVLNESFHSGWVANCDGCSAQTVRANGDFLGCLVEPGQSNIELTFQPASLRVGRLVSVCGLGLWMILAASAVLIRPRRS